MLFIKDSNKWIKNIYNTLYWIKATKNCTVSLRVLMWMYIIKN